MRKALLCGGNEGELQRMEGCPRSLYGFEYLCMAFDPKVWEVDYLGRERAFADPDVLKDYDVALVVFEWNFYLRPEVDTFIDTAHHYGCKIGCEPNGPFSANIAMTSPQDTEQRSRCDFMLNPSESHATQWAQETIHGIPYLPVGPVIEQTYQRELMATAMENGCSRLPEDIETRFVTGHQNGDINFLTIVLAERMGIPLIVNWDYVPPVYAVLHQMILSSGGYKHVEWVTELSHEEWLYQMQMARGVFYMTQYPSGGRPQMWAALADKISIATPSGWQNNLFPGSIIPYGFEGACHFPEKVANAEALKPDTQTRLEHYDAKATQWRMTRFLESQGWA